MQTNSFSPLPIECCRFFLKIIVFTIFLLTVASESVALQWKVLRHIHSSFHRQVISHQYAVNRQDTVDHFQFGTKILLRWFQFSHDFSAPMSIRLSFKWRTGSSYEPVELVESPFVQIVHRHYESDEMKLDIVLHGTHHTKLLVSDWQYQPGCSGFIATQGNSEFEIIELIPDLQPLAHLEPSLIPRETETADPYYFTGDDFQNGPDDPFDKPDSPKLRVFYEFESHVARMPAILSNLGSKRTKRIVIYLVRYVNGQYRRISVSYSFWKKLTTLHLNKSPKALMELFSQGEEKFNLLGHREFTEMYQKLEGAVAAVSTWDVLVRDDMAAWELGKSFSAWLLLLFSNSLNTLYRTVLPHLPDPEPVPEVVRLTEPICSDCHQSLDHDDISRACEQGAGLPLCQKCNEKYERQERSERGDRSNNAEIKSQAKTTMLPHSSELASGTAAIARMREPESAVPISVTDKLLGYFPQCPNCSRYLPWILLYNSCHCRPLCLLCDFHHTSNQVCPQTDCGEPVNVKPGTVNIIRTKSLTADINLALQVLDTKPFCQTPDCSNIPFPPFQLSCQAGHYFCSLCASMVWSENRKGLCKTCRAIVFPVSIDASVYSRNGIDTNRFSLPQTSQPEQNMGSSSLVVSVGKISRSLSTIRPDGSTSEQIELCCKGIQSRITDKACPAEFYRLKQMYMQKGILVRSISDRLGVSMGERFNLLMSNHRGTSRRSSATLLVPHLPMNVLEDTDTCIIFAFDYEGLLLHGMFKHNAYTWRAESDLEKLDHLEYGNINKHRMVTGIASKFPTFADDDAKPKKYKNHINHYSLLNKLAELQYQFSSLYSNRMYKPKCQTSGHVLPDGEFTNPRLDHSPWFTSMFHASWEDKKALKTNELYVDWANTLDRLRALVVTKFAPEKELKGLLLLSNIMETNRIHLDTSRLMVVFYDPSEAKLEFAGYVDDLLDGLSQIADFNERLKLLKSKLLANYQLYKQLIPGVSDYSEIVANTGQTWPLSNTDTLFNPEYFDYFLEKLVNLSLTLRLGATSMSNVYFTALNLVLRLQWVEAGESKFGGAVEFDDPEAMLLGYLSVLDLSQDKGKGAALNLVEQFKRAGAGREETASFFRKVIEALALGQPVSHQDRRAYLYYCLLKENCGSILPEWLNAAALTFDMQSVLALNDASLGQPWQFFLQKINNAVKIQLFPLFSREIATLPPVAISLLEQVHLILQGGAYLNRLKQFYQAYSPPDRVPVSIGTLTSDSVTPEVQVRLKERQKIHEEIRELTPPRMYPKIKLRSWAQPPPFFSEYSPFDVIDPTLDLYKRLDNRKSATLVHDYQSGSRSSDFYTEVTSNQDLANFSGQMCSICLVNLEADSSMTKTLVCRTPHIFHSSCFESAITNNPRCPLCKTMLVPVYTRPQPAGKMTWKAKRFYLPGFNTKHNIIIYYKHPQGVWEGQSYPEDTREAFLPFNDLGVQALKSMITAYERGLTFTVGRSLTRGQDNVVIWSGDVIHKTVLEENDEHGFPDEYYFQRLAEGLNNVGVGMVLQLIPHF